MGDALRTEQSLIKRLENLFLTFFLYILYNIFLKKSSKDFLIYPKILLNAQLIHQLKHIEQIA